MTEEYRRALTEVSEILAFIDTEYIKKIPVDVLIYIDNNKSDEYHFETDLNKSFNEQSLSKETLAFLGWLSVNFFCDSEEEKSTIEKVLDEHEQEYRINIKQKYSPNGVLSGNEIFKNTGNYDSGEDYKSLVKYEEKNFISRMFDAIRHFFKKK